MTAKQVQEAENFCVKENFNRAMSEFYSLGYISQKRLRSCTAWVYETENYYLLKSYNTFIASVNKEDGKLFDALRMVYGFTSTSAQHVSKFWHDYRYGEKFTFRYIK